MPADNLAQTKAAYQAARTSCRLILDNYHRAYEQYIGLSQLYGLGSPKIAQAEKRYLEIRQSLMIVMVEKDRTKKEYEAASLQSPVGDAQ
jgi:hypothetical protein